MAPADLDAIETALRAASAIASAHSEKSVARSLSCAWHYVGRARQDIQRTAPKSDAAWLNLSAALGYVRRADDLLRTRARRFVEPRLEKCEQLLLAAVAASV